MTDKEILKKMITEMTSIEDLGLLCLVCVGYGKWDGGCTRLEQLLEADTGGQDSSSGYSIENTTKFHYNKLLRVYSS